MSGQQANCSPSSEQAHQQLRGSKLVSPACGWPTLAPRVQPCSAGLQNRRGSGLPHGARMLGCTDWSSRAGWARCGQPGHPKVGTVGLGPSHTPRPSTGLVTVNVAHCHLWERRGQQRQLCPVCACGRGRLRPGWGAVCAVDPGKGSGGARAWVFPRALCEAPSDWPRPARREQCCCWGRAETPQHPRIAQPPGVGICGNRPGLPPGATGNSRLGPSCHRPGSWGGVCRARGSRRGRVGTGPWCRAA